MARNLLLIKDVEHIGRSGDVVSVKPGFARNFLLPRGYGVVASKDALRMQARLKEEREKLAALDRKKSEETAASIEGINLITIVKVDHDGHMYGSVSASDIVELLKAQSNIELEKRAITLKHAIKATGEHKLTVKLKEGVTASITLNVVSEKDQAAAENKTAKEAEKPAVSE